MPRHVFHVHRINNILNTFSGLARSSMGWLLQHHLLHPLLPFQHTLCSALLNFSQVLGYAMFSLAWGTACYSYSKGTEFNLDIIFFSRSIIGPTVLASRGSLQTCRILGPSPNVFARKSVFSQEPKETCKNLFKV